MMRDTSIDAYNEIKENGLLSLRRWQVYDCVYQKGPMTANDMIRELKKFNPKLNQTGFQPRLSEMEKMGVIAVVGEKIDEISGMRGKLWDVTSKLPIKPDRKESNQEKVKRLQKLLNWICKQYPDLKQRIVEMNNHLKETI